MDEIILVNKMESAVKRMLDDIIKSREKEVCACERCKLDIIALALNSLPPKYVVTEIGNAVINVDLDSAQGKANVTMAVCNAIDVVNRRPRHD
ncbi:MAG: late competence development ComFB family protein [Candidatus Rifleibacteriota bacterium]